MSSEFATAMRCQAVGRLLQLPPTSREFEAFRNLFPDAQALDEDVVQQDYLHLFVGLGTPLAPPWESAWANDARLLFQRETLDVRYWYRSSGLQITALHKEPDDHIGLELEFIGLLLERGEAKTARTFARKHPLTWAERWKDAVEELAHAPYYPLLAREALELLDAVAH